MKINNLIKETEKGCGEFVFRDGIDESGQGDKIVCGTFWSGRPHYCLKCLQTLKLLKQFQKEIKELEKDFFNVWVEEDGKTFTLDEIRNKIKKRFGEIR